MKALWVVFCCLALAACDAGSTASSATPVSVTGNLLRPADLNGLVLQVPDQTAVYANSSQLGHPDGAGSYAQGQTQISFDGAGNVTISSAGSTPQVLSWDDSQGAYVGQGQVLFSGITTIDTTVMMTFYDDPAKPGIYIWKFVSINLPTSPSFQGVGYTAFTENPTPGANLPTSGKPTYSGTVEATDQALATADGTIRLTANLAKAIISGTITLDDGTAFGATSFGIAKATINKSAGSTGFSSTLTSSDVSVSGSGVSGTFSGTTGKDVVGGFYVNDAKGDGLAGAYSAGQ